MALPAADRALSPAAGGADGFGPVRKLLLDAVSSPLTRVMYARALYVVSPDPPDAPSGFPAAMPARGASPRIDQHG